MLWLKWKKGQDAYLTFSVYLVFSWSKCQQLTNSGGDTLKSQTQTQTAEAGRIDSSASFIQSGPGQQRGHSALDPLWAESPPPSRPWGVTEGSYNRRKVYKTDKLINSPPGYICSGSFFFPCFIIIPWSCVMTSLSWYVVSDLWLVRWFDELMYMYRATTHCRSSLLHLCFWSVPGWEQDHTSLGCRATSGLGQVMGEGLDGNIWLGQSAAN